MTVLSREERTRAGEEARRRVPPGVHARWAPAPDRPDPVALLMEQGVTRVPELVPIRYGRMLVSPFTFFRGAALPMAADLAATPTSGFTVQLVGDAHLSNFGLFASPERNLLFDMNDFDETLPGPWEWDLKRLAASLVVAARDRGFDRHQGRKAAKAACVSYHRHMAEYATMRAIDVYYSRVDVSAVAEYVDEARTAVPPEDRRCCRAPRHDPRVAQDDDDRGWQATDRGPPSYHLSPRVRPPERSGRDARRVSPHPPGRPTGPPRSLRDRGRRREGRRGGERRARRARGPVRRRGPGRSAPPPGEGGGGVRPRALPPEERARESRGARRGGPAIAAGRERRLPRLGEGPARTSSVPAPAPGPEGERGHRRDVARRPRQLGRAVRLGPRTRPRALRRSCRAHRVSRGRRGLRRGARGLRRGLRGPDREGPRVARAKRRRTAGSRSRPGSERSQPARRRGAARPALAVRARRLRHRDEVPAWDGSDRPAHHVERQVVEPGEPHARHAHVEALPLARYSATKRSRRSSFPYTPIRYSAMWRFCDASAAYISGSPLYVSG